MMTVRTSGAKADRPFLVYIAILLVFGFIALISASGPVGYAKFDDPYFFVKRQLLYGIIPGIAAFLILAKIHYSVLQRFAWYIYAATLVLLVLVFIPGVGLVINGARSWIHVAGFNLQPAEFAKLGLVVALALILTEKKYNWDRWQDSLVPVLAPITPAVLLVLAQPDVGTLAIMVTIIFVMLLIGQVPFRYLAILGLLGVIAFGVLVIKSPYRADRISVFLHPELDPKGVGYHINQAFLAVGSGGFWGLGFGHSRQKFQYLPEVDADSIYAVIAEENGFLVAGGLVVLILLIGSRGLRIANSSPDPYAKLLVSGIIVWFTWQSFLNIGAMVGALPLTGVPLPLVSHGGTAMIAVLASLGVVVNVSKQTRLN